ncbi:phosphoribosylglycinamide formyltransferase [Candidatus Micrarchaeota archaeon]|nr:phosphoribosylglycinamide formyltransferase [Candidatus Micrarchaeota archaeon]
MIKIAILASGRGSNFKSIMEEIRAGRCNAHPVVLITNNPDAPAIDIAKENNIPVEIVNKKDFASREAFDSEIKQILDRYEAGLVVLAGYMLILRGRDLLEAYKNKIINIHPSLLPAFPGVEAQKQAFDHGCKVSGVTIHFVDPGLDSGPIIYQEAVDISDCKTAEETAAKILKTEHRAYAKVIDMFSKGTFTIDGRRAMFTSGKIRL